MQKTCARTPKQRKTKNIANLLEGKEGEKRNWKKLAMVSLCGFLSLVYLIVNSSMKSANIYVSVDLRVNNFKRERDFFNECVCESADKKKGDLSVLNQNIKCLRFLI